MKLALLIETDTETIRLEMPTSREDHEARDRAEGSLPTLIRLLCERFRWEIYGDAFGAKSADYTIRQLLRELQAWGIVVERVAEVA